MNTLYEITKDNGEKAFAVKIAEKSKSIWIMEVKGTNEYLPVMTTNIQEVVPYTVKLKILGGICIHYEAEEGKVKQGDILVLKSGDIGVVVEVDTKVKGVNELEVLGRLQVSPF